MNLKRLAILGGVILVSGGCAPDRLVSPAAPSGQLVRSSDGANVSAQPMYIVDGAIYTTEHGRPQLAPDQIAEIQVLKGEQARRTFGEAGAHGVVVITTKQAAANGMYYGLTPEGALSIRGPAQGAAADHPLVLVDGVIVPVSALRDIDADDIRDIQVLKGPAAVQQYGDRAADGVVLVRTKGAESGS